jgi:hypothetical protein
MRLLQAIRPKGAKVSVVSGTSTGKTFTFGAIVLWHFLAMPAAIVKGKVEIGSNTYIAAPVVQQVSDGIWKEIGDAVMAMRQGPHGWIVDYFEVTRTRLYMHGYNDQWFVGQVALQQGKSVSIAGKHRYWQLIIVDEAPGASDDHMNVIEGTQTSPGARTLMAGQGIKNVGRFYDSHHSLSVENGGSWVPLVFSSERSPFATDEWLKQRAIESGGRNSVEYRVRVRGEFVDNSSNHLLTRDDVESLLKPRTVPLIGEDEAYGILILSDVALGEYRDDSVITLAKMIGTGDFGLDAQRVDFFDIPLANNDKNEIDLAGDLRNLYSTLDNPSLYVDNGGIGHAVCKMLDRAGVPVNRIDWGKPCFSREYQARYFNQRACANVRFRDAIKQGRVSMSAKMSQRLRQKIIDQGSRLPYHYSETGGLRYVMMRKEDMRKEGIKSPDIWDTLSFPFLEGVSYIPRSGASATGDGAAARQAALDRLRASRSQQSEEVSGSEAA